MICCLRHVYHCGLGDQNAAKRTSLVSWALGCPGSGNTHAVPKADEFFFLKDQRHP